MGGKSSSSSSTSTSSSVTTKTRNLNLQGTSGSTIAGNDTVTIHTTDAAALDAVKRALDSADTGVSTAAQVTLAALGAIGGAADFVKETNAAAFDFANKAQQPDGGATVIAVKWLAGGAAVVAAVVFLFGKGK